MNNLKSPSHSQLTEKGIEFSTLAENIDILLDWIAFAILSGVIVSTYSNPVSTRK